MLLGRVLFCGLLVLTDGLLVIRRECCYRQKKISQTVKIRSMPIAFEGSERRFMPIVEEFAGDRRIQKIAVWVGFVSVLRILEPFYALMALTFLLTFVGASIIDASRSAFIAVARRCVRLFSQQNDEQNFALLPPRRVFAALYIATVIISTSLIFIRYAPIVTREAQYAASAVAANDPYYRIAKTMRSTLGDTSSARLEAIARSIAEGHPDLLATAANLPTDRSGKYFLSTESLADAVRQMVAPYVISLVTTTTNLLKPVPSLLADLATATLFSFLLVWDLPKFASSLARLGSSHLPWVRFSYAEIAPRVRSFAKLLGTNFEIQGIIAFVNTVLTTIGLISLKASGIAFLALLTFICSFIPVLGVVVATIPALFLCPTPALLLGVITFIHLAEAYILYPQIYANKLKIHPLLVLTSLYTFEHYLGISGFFVAIPLSVFFVQTLLGASPHKNKAAEE